MAVVSRRICWPDPDATCLEGGCGQCNSHPFRSLTQIAEFAWHAGEIPNRGVGSKDAWSAYKYGERSGWPNVDTRRETR